ncbi:Transcriptional regulator, AraC family [Pseudomonas syringae pv. philadelphi]|nr:Transcriptional regulator, AraC family [Pseudomonas syringae pv. berberidis]KPY09175.1 Transcriptional regulator, AraC family [Pseudomonas syringae pv. philadelphi]RMM29986.1 Transcriptional regulator, AraC family [Pseudomonas syringae pv. berberidis]RMP68861.1 Transcriptional regulator, AraC family [Pseudomonas syringae pv. berberidis]RMQ30251.1 Transcriptional regulator, AraC family [Pseudomonas syringae pv. berberidis]
MSLAFSPDGNATLVSLIQPLAVRPGFVATHLPAVRVLSAFGYVASSPQIY